MKKFLKHLLASPKTSIGGAIGLVGVGMAVYSDPTVLSDPEKMAQLAAASVAALAAISGKDWGQPKPKQ